MLRFSGLLVGLLVSLFPPAEKSAHDSGRLIAVGAILDTPARVLPALPPLRIIGASPRRISEALQLHEGRPYAEWVRMLARHWQGIPYGSGGAGTRPHELLINLEQMDCMTAVENLMAIHRLHHSRMAGVEGFARSLVEVRYHVSQPCRLEDRYHYLTHAFMEWEQAAWGTWLPLGIPDSRPIRYISQNPRKYAGFTDWQFLRRVEGQLSRHPRYYIPSAQIQDWLPLLQDGDLIAFVSPQDGLDVSHVGIFFREGDRATFAHASLLAKKWVYGEDLCAYLDRRGEKVKGITVFRPFE